MRKKRKWIGVVNAVTDAVLIFLSYLIASWLWLDVARDITATNIAGIESIQSGMGLAAVLYSLWTVFILHCLNVYRESRLKRFLNVVRNIVVGNFLSVVMVAAILYLFRLQDFSRGVLLLFYIFACGFLVGKRLIMRIVLQHSRIKGYNLRHVLVVGGGSLAQRYAEAIAADETLGIRVDEIIDPDEDLVSRLENRLHNEGIDEVILALAPDEQDALIPCIQQSEKSGTKISVVPFYNDVIPTRPDVEVVGSIKLIQLRTTPLDDPFAKAGKRLMDIVGSALLLVILFPFFLIIAFLVKVSSPGPVLFSQQRIGLNKKPFKMLKFRSMKVNGQQDTAWSKNKDDRRTPIGSFLRKFSLDEFPQLINVLKGDMSLVGPRPEIPHFVEKFRETVPLYMVKYQVRPGMTGWAQVNGLRGDTSIPERVKCDLWYIENWSFGLDIKILFKTLFGGMINREQITMSKDEPQKKEAVQ